LKDGLVENGIQQRQANDDWIEKRQAWLFPPKAKAEPGTKTIKQNNSSNFYQQLYIQKQHQENQQLPVNVV
jgi:hypothetical protein